MNLNVCELTTSAVYFMSMGMPNTFGVPEKIQEMWFSAKESVKVLWTQLKSNNVNRSYYKCLMKVIILWTCR